MLKEIIRLGVVLFASSVIVIPIVCWLRVSLEISSAIGLICGSIGVLIFSGYIETGRNSSLLSYFAFMKHCDYLTRVIPAKFYHSRIFKRLKGDTKKVSDFFCFIFKIKGRSNIVSPGNKPGNDAPNKKTHKSNNNCGHKWDNHIY